MTARFTVALVFSLHFGCGESAPDASGAVTLVAAPVKAKTPVPGSQPTGDQRPIEALNALDHRTPVPLQPMMAWHQKQNMMAHLVAIERIVDGAARQDWAAVASGSALIESSPQMQQMCQHMGQGADGFTEQALEFHRRADAIGVAARAKDGPAVLRATADTLKACTGCHGAYRQDVVDAATWRSRTGGVQSPASQPQGAGH